MGARVVTVALGGQSRRLFYSTAAAARAERGMGGKSIRQALVDTSMADLLVLLTIGLQIGEHNERLTQEQVGLWIDDAKKGEQSAYEFWNPVAEALAASGIIPAPRASALPEERGPASLSGGDEDPTMSSPRPGSV